MLDERERREWVDIERRWAVEPHRPELGRFPRLEEMPAAVAGIVWLSLVAVLLGAVVLGLVAAAVTLAGWALWTSRMPPPRDPDALMPGRRNGPSERRPGEPTSSLESAGKVDSIRRVS